MISSHESPRSSEDEAILELSTREVPIQIVGQPVIVGRSSNSKSGMIIPFLPLPSIV
jgi:hypothetical protein